LGRHLCLHHRELKLPPTRSPFLQQQSGWVEPWIQASLSSRPSLPVGGQFHWATVWAGTCACIIAS